MHHKPTPSSHAQPEEISAWYTSLPESLRWVEHHEWTVENYWDTMVRVRASWMPHVLTMQSADINYLHNTGNTRMVELVPEQQALFEASFWRSRAVLEMEVPDTMICLDYIRIYAEEFGPSRFTWNIDWLHRIATSSPSDYLRNMREALRSMAYTDEQKLPVLVHALSLPSTKLRDAEEALAKQSAKLKRPLSLAAALEYAKCDNPVDKMAIFTAIDSKLSFSLKYTAKDLVAAALPEALPAWDTLVSLDLPFAQAWALVSQQYKTEASVEMPASFDV